MDDAERAVPSASIKIEAILVAARAAGMAFVFDLLLTQRPIDMEGKDGRHTCEIPRRDSHDVAIHDRFPGPISRSLPRADSCW
jgi:hypothetical protein